MKLMSEDKQELILPEDAKGKIAFENKEAGEKFIKENPEKVAELQEYVKTYKAEKNKELYPAESYKNSYEETEGGYLVTLNNGNKLELPKDDVTKLEDGNIKADIYYDKEYTLYIKDQKTTINGDGVKGELTRNATKTTAETAKQTAEATKQTVETAKQTVETAKQAAETVKQGADAVKQTVDTGVQATVAVADVATTAVPPVKIAEEAVKVVGETVDAAAKVGEGAFKGVESAITFASDPAQNLVEAANKAIDGAANVVDAGATFFPPAKAVTSSVNIVYKSVSGVASGAKNMSKSVQKI